MDKVSYALGLSIGNNFQNSGINNLQIEDFVKGLKDVLEMQRLKSATMKLKKLSMTFL